MLFCLSHFLMFSHISGGSSFPQPLTAKEEEKYIKEYQNGSEEAKNILIEKNLRLVAHIAKKYSSNAINDSDDLISIGTIGLIKAVNTFKPSRGTKLATYAARCIENEILMSIRSSKKTQNDVYLQDTVGIDKDGNEVTLQDKIADPSINIDEQVTLKMQVASLYAKLRHTLKPREREIIDLRYGLTSGEEITQREIAKLMGISRSYVSRIEKKALKKLFSALND